MDVCDIGTWELKYIVNQHMLVVNKSVMFKHEPGDNQSSFRPIRVNHDMQCELNSMWGESIQSYPLAFICILISLVCLFGHLI